MENNLWHLFSELMLCSLWLFTGFMWGRVYAQKKICRHWNLLADIMRILSECYGTDRNVYHEICRIYEKHRDKL